MRIMPKKIIFTKIINALVSTKSFYISVCLQIVSWQLKINSQLPIGRVRFI